MDTKKNDVQKVTMTPENGGPPGISEIPNLETIIFRVHVS